jgi:DNA-binding response OmpR family regulator
VSSFGSTEGALVLGTPLWDAEQHGAVQIRHTFDTLELLARVDALLRRTQPHPTHRVLQFGPLRMDVRATEVSRDGKEIKLSTREFQLLRHFMEHPGEILTRKELLQEVWGYEDGMFSRTVDVHIANLRQKLEKDAKHPELILTVQRTGYKFKASAMTRPMQGGNVEKGR